MRQLHRELPSVMKELHRLEFEYADGSGMDFEPYTEFLGEDETRNWIRAWTGNMSLDGTEYRIFGQDGSGGYAAFWCVRPNVSVLGQPIVFFGSEGELGVLASDFWDYLWLLAGGFGPYEALAYPDGERRHTPNSPRSQASTLARTKAHRQKFYSEPVLPFPSLRQA
jgi:hypothetical protein